MPLNKKGRTILTRMTKTYGSEKKATSVLYASINAGTITGAEKRATVLTGTRKKARS